MYASGGEPLAVDRRIFPARDDMPATSDDEDARHVALTLEGDRHAFTLIVEKYTPIFHPLVRRMRYDWTPESVEDALQEIFLLIYRALPSYRKGRPFFPWAYTIALNWLRSQRRKVRSNKMPLQVPYDDTIHIVRSSDGFGSPEASLISREADRMVFRALEDLKPRYREVFILRMMQGLSVADTARVLHIPEGTVKTLLHRAQKQLRTWLQDHQWDMGE
jgi:RNA polymerase sigma-70 factor (ECF subfamily)